LHAYEPAPPVEPYTTSGSYVKGQGHVSFFVFFCVHNAAATCGRYLALSKARWSCFRFSFIADV